MATAYKVVGGDMTSIYTSPKGHVYEVGSRIDASSGSGIWAYTRLDAAALLWAWTRSKRLPRYRPNRYSALVLELSFATRDVRYEGVYDSRTKTIALLRCRVERVVPAEELLEILPIAEKNHAERRKRLKLRTPGRRVDWARVAP